MKNLLLSNFERIFKSKLFWFITAAILVFTAYTSLNGAKKISDNERAVPEMICYEMGPIVLTVMPVFVSLFLGTEYSDGGMRNKIIIGIPRLKIYLANFISISCASLIFCAAWHIGSLTALPVLGIWQKGVNGWLFAILKSALFILEFCAILCPVSHIISNKSAVAVAEIFLALALLVAGSVLNSWLLEPKEISSYQMVIVEDNQQPNIVMSEPEPNPYYISEPERTVAKMALNTLPTGQAIILASRTDPDVEKIDMPMFSVFASLTIAVLFSAVGAMIFRRKDVR